MDQKSQEKVMNAGFTIIRLDNQPGVRIKFKGVHPELKPESYSDPKGIRKQIANIPSAEWRTLEKFDTKAARDRRFQELLESEVNIIQD